MITSSNFFNKNLFADDFQQLPTSQQMGPWVEDNKQHRYATLDSKIKRDKHLDSLIPIYHPIRNNRYSENRKTPTGSSIEIEFEKPEHKYHSVKTSKEKEMMFNLPRIESKTKRSGGYRDHLTARKNTVSPLAAELNFIYKVSKSRNGKYKGSRTYQHFDSTVPVCRLESFLTSKDSKYNIYEKCVVEIKKHQPINSQRKSRAE